MDWREGEVAADNWLQMEGYMTRRAVRARFQKVDFFGADVMGKRSGGMAWVQVTTAQGSRHTETVRRRRRRLEEVPWGPQDLVFVFEARERPNVVDPRRIDRFFRVHEYASRDGGEGPRSWRVLKDPIVVTADMLTVRRSPEDHEDEDHKGK